MSGATLVGIPGTLRLSVVSFNTQISASLQSFHLRMGRVHVPVKVNQGIMNVTCQASSERNYRQFQVFVRKHHQSALRDKKPELRFIYPAQGIDFVGYILKSPAGARAFEWAPQFQFQMLLTKDLVNTTTNSFSQVESFDVFYQQDIDVDDLPWNLPDGSELPTTENDEGTSSDDHSGGGGTGGGTGPTVIPG